jgi:hypothetical protein
MSWHLTITAWREGRSYPRWEQPIHELTGINIFLSITAASDSSHMLCNFTPIPQEPTSSGLRYFIVFRLWLRNCRANYIFVPYTLKQCHQCHNIYKRGVGIPQSFGDSPKETCIKYHASWSSSWAHSDATFRDARN